ncbi:hypothetical protein HYW76_03385 [Candidatus Pacearchaeota archaeon]|nr:hypothetical protein [Candidatus Pacearchaeota archaeon]
MKICPVCKSEKISMLAGGITGMYECMNCGYRGSLIIEEQSKKKQKNEG